MHLQIGRPWYYNSINSLIWGGYTMKRIIIALLVACSYTSIFSTQSPENFYLNALKNIVPLYLFMPSFVPNEKTNPDHLTKFNNALQSVQLHYNRAIQAKRIFDQKNHKI